ncbi:phage tail terminator-like protein [Rhodosalinus sediminis]|uniref:phage tail terminator-like protein n=1 Tax=Rhodosalinus sediminis TaxID=1940533 RepID=UPI0023525105|nr:phage tail terminator-like protein [Rhodosalinus sediminis]
MTHAEIDDALAAHLHAAGIGAPIVWPNATEAPERPFLSYLPPSGEREGGSLKGGTIARETGVLQVQVVAADNTGRSAALALAEAVAAAFAEGTRLAGGRIEIPAPPSVRQGFAAGGDWIVPVVIRYRAP